MRQTPSSINYAAVLQPLLIAVADERARTFHSDVFAAPSTIEPDRMQASPRNVRILGVNPGSSVTLADAARTVVIYPIAKTHAFDMVIVHLPQQNILYEGPVQPRLPARVAEGSRAPAARRHGHAGLDQLTDRRHPCGNGDVRTAASLPRSVSRRPSESNTNGPFIALGPGSRDGAGLRLDADIVIAYARSRADPFRQRRQGMELPSVG